MSRKLDFADGFESSSEPQVGTIRATSLNVYADDAAFVAGKGSVAVGGDIYLNSTDGYIHIHDGTTWKKLVIDKHLSSYDISVSQPVDTVMTLTGAGHYIVGANQLYVALDGQLLLSNVDYEEIGTSGTTSTTVLMKIALEPGDMLVIRT
jgi:hypothetical protein